MLSEKNKLLTKKRVGQTLTELTLVFVLCKFGGQKLNCEFRLGISVKSL